MQYYTEGSLICKTFLHGVYVSYTCFKYADKIKLLRKFGSWERLVPYLPIPLQLFWNFHGNTPGSYFGFQPTLPAYL